MEVAALSATKRHIQTCEEAFPAASLAHPTRLHWRATQHHNCYRLQCKAKPVSHHKDDQPLVCASLLTAVRTVSQPPSHHSRLVDHSHDCLKQMGGHQSVSRHQSTPVSLRSSSQSTATTRRHRLGPRRTALYLEWRTNSRGKKAFGYDLRNYQQTPNRPGSGTSSSALRRHHGQRVKGRQYRPVIRQSIQPTAVSLITP